MQDKKDNALVKELCKGGAAVIVSLMFIYWRLGETGRGFQSPDSVDRLMLFSGLSCLALLLLVAQLSDWVKTRSWQSAWRCFLALGLTVFLVVQAVCIYQQ
jgi:hypothetical protein